MIEAAGFSLHVLVVDDVAMNQVVAQALLQKLGHNVAVASSGQQALELLAANRFDLVLMDIQMPDMDGFETTRRIRSHETEHGQPHVPVCALTALASPDDAARCHAAGMDCHLTKPVTKNALNAMIERVFTTGLAV